MGQKLKFIFVLLFFMVSVSNIFAQWETQNSPINSNLNDICFVDSINGWIIGDSSIVLRTTNSGLIWEEQNVPAISESMNRIQFVDKNVGYIICNSGLLLKTYNGGIKWDTIYTSYNINFRDMSFVDESEGWIAGYKVFDNYANSLVLHTTDGGEKWEVQVDAYSTNQFLSKLFTAVKMKDSLTGWALAGDYFDTFSDTYVYKTTNGGETWEQLSELETNLSTQLKIANGDTLWAGGYAFLASFDGGINWKGEEEETDYVITLSAPINGLAGWGYCRQPLGNNKRILLTTNGGAKWKDDLTLEDSISIIAMNYASGYLWAVGTNGTILKRKDNITDVDEIDYTLPTKFTLYQNYPNPFNPQTTISYFLSEAGTIKLDIYGINGECVYSSGFSQKAAG